MSKKAAHDLLTLGVAVVDVMDTSSRVYWERLLWQAIDDMPEFRVKGRDYQRVLGGFGALGNPSSFHHPTVRQFRKKIKRLVVKEVMREYVLEKYNTRDIRLESLFDRLCVRCEAFQRPTAEKWHRDIYDATKYKLRTLPKSLPNNTLDEMIGGWTNLASADQSFVGILKTHNDTLESDVGGFSTFSDADIKRFRFKERLAEQSNMSFGHTIRCNDTGEILIPPGCTLLFFQRLIHSVKSGPQPLTPALRVFHGFRLTTEEVPLFDHEGVLVNGAVPRIPSGQMPPMYSQNHYAAFSNPSEPKWRTWGTQVFKTECLFRRTTPTGVVFYTPGSRDNTNAAANLGRYMPSLREMGLWSEKYEYSQEERDALFPQRLFM